MGKQQLNEVARFQAIAGLKPIGSLGEGMAVGGNEVTAALNAVTMLDANQVEDFLNGLAKYFVYNEEELTNIDVKALVHYLRQAASVMQAKTGM